MEIDNLKSTSVLFKNYEIPPCNPRKFPRSKSSTPLAVNQSPIIWRRYGVGYRIECLTESFYNEALKILHDYYSYNDFMIKSFNFDDESLECFLSRAHFHIQANDSLIIIDESVRNRSDGTVVEEDEVAGVLVARIVKRTDFYQVLSRTSIMTGEGQINYVQFKNDLNKNMDLWTDFKCDQLLKIYYVCIKPKYRRKGSYKKKLQSFVLFY